MNFEQVQKVLDERNEPGFRMKQIKQAVFVNLISSWEEVTTFSKDLRAALAATPVSSLTVEETLKSADGHTEKVLFGLADGDAKRPEHRAERGGEKIEAVLIKSKDERNTVCVSSQAGCSLACAFCATGKMGCRRDLTAEEIVDQVMHFARELKKSGDHISNVVVMGMGEPFLNYDNVLKALRTLNDKEGFNMGARSLSVSTSGIIPGIQRFAHENFQVNLAISLHAPNDTLRSKLMPINRKYHLKDVMAAVEEYVKLTNRKVFFEYLLIDRVNDNDNNAEELAKLMSANHLYHVNLIKYNVTSGKFRASPYERREAFKNILEKHRIPVTFRVSFGEDISAACGQLAGR